MLKQKALQGWAARRRKTSRAAVTAHDTVAGYNKRQGIATQGGPDSTRPAPAAKLGGYPGIGSHLPKGNQCRFVPDPVLKRGCRTGIKRRGRQGLRTCLKILHQKYNPLPACFPVSAAAGKLQENTHQSVFTLRFSQKNTLYSRLTGHHAAPANRGPANIIVRHAPALAEKPCPALTAGNRYSQQNKGLTTIKKMLLFLVLKNCTFYAHGGSTLGKS
jgi:hypothetical protein